MTRTLTHEPEIDLENAIATTQVATGSDTKEQSNDRNHLALGGISGILAGVTYIVGFVIFGVTLRDLFDEDKLDAIETVKFLKDNEAVFYSANFLVYILNGFLQIILACVVHQYLSQEHANSPHYRVYTNIATAIGCIWGALVVAAGMIGNGGAHVAIDLYDTEPERASTLWATIDAVYTNGIGGGNEVVGAVWVLMASILSFGCGKAFPRPLNILGAIAGIAGLVTIVPGLDEAASVFGIVMVVWYILAGMWLLRAFSQK